MRKIFLFIFLLSSALCAQERPFRFAWLTDTHVGSETGEEDLRRSVRDINSLNGISFVILSGDVTEMGSTRELRLAKSILDSLRVPYHVIPGNHDTKWSESGCSMFARLWKDDKFVFEFSGVRFIACSSGPNMRQGDGHVPEEDVLWLDSVTAHIKSAPVVFICHYPLDESLDNWYDILSKIKRVNTIAALCGHGHNNHPLMFEGVPGVMARSNLRARKSTGGYTLVDVRADSLIFSERTPMIASSADSMLRMGREQEWHAIANTRHDYASDTAHYVRPDFSVNHAYAGVHERWKAATGYTIGSSPALADSECVIVGNNKGFIEGYALQSGKKLWSCPTSGSVYSTAAVAPVGSELRAVVGSSDGTIYCLNPGNGKVIWTHKAEASVVASSLIRNGVVYIGSSDGIFRALSLSSGATIWEHPGIEGFVETTPTAYEGKIIFGAWDTYLYALDEKTGALVWKWSNGKPTRNLSPAACTPVAADGKIFIVAPDRYTTALDAATGREVWRTAAHQVREMIGVSEDGQTIYTRSMNDTLFAFAAKPDSIEQLWSVDCKYGYDFAPSMPVEKDGSIFFGTRNGLVCCVNARTHELAWVHKIGNTVITTVKPLSATDVLVASMSGSIVYLTNKP